MATNANTVVPAMATHPGSVLKKELMARGIKQKTFAQAIGMPAPNLSELIRGKRNITEAIAIKLEEALGIPFQNWMNLQNRYHYVMKRIEERSTRESLSLAEECSLRSKLNLSLLYKYFNITSNHPSERVDALKSHLAIDLTVLDSLEANTIGFFKRSDRLKVDEINMRTWLLMAGSMASKVVVDDDYSPEKGMLAAGQIAGLANSGELSLSSIEQVLNSSGIIYVHVPKIDAAPIDAYSMMVGSHPAIVVTYRHNDMDKLAFDILHELGHILFHIAEGKSFIAMEDDYSSQSKVEMEANKFANDTLISPKLWNMIMSVKPHNLTPHAVVHTIAKEAKKYGVSASIAVARYKHDTRCYNIRGYRSPKILV